MSPDKDKPMPPGMSPGPTAQKPEMELHIPLHKKLGMEHAELGKQTDQNTVATIAQAYIDQIKAGEMEVEAIGELSLGEGRYIRTFVINEKVK